MDAKETVQGLQLVLVLCHLLGCKHEIDSHVVEVQNSLIIVYYNHDRCNLEVYRILYLVVIPLRNLGHSLCKG